MKSKRNEADSDDGLEVLRDVFSQAQPDVPWSLVESCYRIERRYQYEADREMAISDIKAAVSQFVAKKLESAH